MAWFRLVSIAWLLLASALAAAQGPVRALEPAHVEAPTAGAGPLLVLLTGADGASTHLGEARAFAREGWLVVVLNSAQLDAFAPAELEATLKLALARPDVRSAKASLVGYSLGGWLVIAQGSRMPQLVSAAVAYYPSTMRVRDPATFWSDPPASVPTLMLAGVRDTYMNCCTIERARALQAAASAQRAPVELVEYPEADHGFVLPVYAQVYRPDDAADALRRANAHLRARLAPV